MTHRHIDLKIPPGMALQLHADGIHRIMLANRDIVKLHDWAVDLTKSLKGEALKHIELEKQEEERKKAERQERIKRVPVDQVSILAREEKRIEANEHNHLNHTPIPLTEPLPDRTIKTKSGEVLEVKGDVSDDDLNSMGIEIAEILPSKKLITEIIPANK